MRDQKTKEAFISFLQDPKTKDLRFWQAIYAFTKVISIFIQKDREASLTDPFYIESDEKPMKTISICIICKKKKCKHSAFERVLIIQKGFRLI